MSTSLRRLVFWGVPVVVLAGAIAYAFRPQPVDVDLWTVRAEPMTVTVAEQGETRIRDIFVISAPVRGQARRIEIDEGDQVVAGETIVAEIEPTDPDLFDLRTEVENRAAVQMARAAVVLAEAELQQAEAELEFAKAELNRAEQLRARETVAARAVEDAQRVFRNRKAALATAVAAIDMRKAELVAAEARLMKPQDADDPSGACPCIPVHAPISGQVLRVHHESEGVVAAGEALIEVGNPRNLEIVVDYLSADAVKIEVGQRALIDQWGGDGSLNGRVERIEPFGFTKVSALGIEEQRVNVIIALTDPGEAWQRLGHGFQVEANVVLWETDAALTVPLTALVREQEDWGVFEVSGGMAVLQSVVLGQRNHLYAEIVSGLAAGDRVIRYPSERIEHGTPVRQR